MLDNKADVAWHILDGKGVSRAFWLYGCWVGYQYSKSCIFLYLFLHMLFICLVPVVLQEHQLKRAQSVFIIEQGAFLIVLVLFMKYLH